VARRRKPRLSDNVRTALESDDRHEIDELVKARRQADFAELAELLSPEVSVPSDYRSKALYALGRSKDPSFVPAIRRLLPELNERGRISAIDALGRLGTPEAIAEISAQRADESPQVRKFVVLALKRSRTREARRAVTEIAADDPEEWVRDLPRVSLGAEVDCARLRQSRHHQAHRRRV
jgi:HEAT repeat protein